MLRAMIPAILLVALYPSLIHALPSGPSDPLARLDDTARLPYTHDIGAATLSAIYADTARTSGPPAAAASEGGGWLSRWLSMGGEGDMTVILSRSENLTLPHRPAAFPTQLFSPMTLPMTGLLLPFTSLNHTSPTRANDVDRSILGVGNHGRRLPTVPMGYNPELGCLRPSFPTRYVVPPRPWKIALIERGECDFASKVRAAQERGAAAVVVGDGKLRTDETDEEGRSRESLITMFSPEHTEAIFIPSVFVSRASFLALRDMLHNGTTSTGYPPGGLWIELGQGSDDGATLSSLLSFALLMPTLFLLMTIGVHRFRLARQREADRAPPLLVLSLPERIWTPDIVWEKDSETSSLASPSPTAKPTPTLMPTPDRSASPVDTPILPPPPPIGPSEVAAPPPIQPDNHHHLQMPEPSGSRKKVRTQSGQTTQSKSAKRYFSRDECAICMDSFVRGDVVRILPCGHVFHKDECDEWLLKWRKLCPTCRADVTLPSGEVDAGSTLTPVAPPLASGQGVDEGEDAHMSWAQRVSQALSSGRARLFGSTSIPMSTTNEAAAVTERTPLVASTGSSRNAQEV